MFLTHKGTRDLEFCCPYENPLPQIQKNQGEAQIQYHYETYERNTSI